MADNTIKRIARGKLADNIMEKEVDNILSQFNKSSKTLLERIEALEKKGSWFSGLGLPDNSIGNNGDYYLDLGTKNIYKKESDRWL